MIAVTEDYIADREPRLSLIHCSRTHFECGIMSPFFWGSRLTTLPLPLGQIRIPFGTTVEELNNLLYALKAESFPQPDKE